VEGEPPIRDDYCRFADFGEELVELIRVAFEDGIADEDSDMPGFVGYNVSSCLVSKI
jgi:hypothetical protein